LPVLVLALAHLPPQMPIIFTMVFLLGCAVIAAQAFLYAVAPQLYPIAVRGIGVGAAVAAGRIGSILGPKLGGFLQSAGHSYSQVLMDLLPIVIVCSLSALLLAWLTSRGSRPVNLPRPRISM
jgi:AAHS family 3-hydroxyphenylpropionic acid transporter